MLIKRYVKTTRGLIDTSNTNINAVKCIINSTYGLNNETIYVGQSDDLKELCDRYIIVYAKDNSQRVLKTFIKVEREFLKDKMYELNHIKHVYGAIWVKGEHDESILKSVAELTEGGLKLL